MGRAVYSSAYTTTAPIPAVAVRTEPEPTVDTTVERWSSYNPFDPDSDEFFENAEFEAFITQDELRARQSEATPLITDRIADMSDSSDSSSDQDSDSAGGSADQSRVSSPTGWTNQDAQSAPQQPEATTSTSPLTVNDDTRRTYLPGHTFVNVSDLFPAMTAAAGGASSTPHVIGRSRSPTLSPPSTPPPPQTFPIFRRQGTPTRLVTPSPPPSVTPRLYSWPAPPTPTTPASPSFLPVSRGGPLPNARARMSYTRIDTTPVRVRITNPVM